MITPRRLSVGSDPQDLAKGSRGSAVALQHLRNRGSTTLYVSGEPGSDDALPLGPGESLPGLSLGSADHLWVWRDADEIEKAEPERRSEPADVVLGWA